MISKRAEFSITRCNPEIRDDCKDASEIDLFIQDIGVDVWSIFGRMDVSLYNAYPVIHV